MTEHRRLLEEDLARLVTQTNDSINHRRELLAWIEDRLSTEIGPLTLYRIYLLGDQGNILLRQDVHARSNADAIQAAWHWLALMRSIGPTKPEVSRCGAAVA
jgi:hypothetical protein